MKSLPGKVLSVSAHKDCTYCPVDGLVITAINTIDYELVVLSVVEKVVGV